MKKVLICSPSIGDFLENLAVADSICELATNQGYIPVVSSTIVPGLKSAGVLQQRQINQCDEVWLYCAQGQALAAIFDLRSAVKAGKAGKPVKLVREIPQVTPRTAAADACFAADSYAEAADLDDGGDQAETGADPSPEMTLETFSLDGLLLALRELDDIMGGVLPYDWWETVSRARGDYLARLGVGGLMECFDFLMDGGVLPHWPFCWKAELATQFGGRDWLAELPDLDPNNLDKIGDSQWHKLGHQLFLAGEYLRALDFLAEAVIENPQNYLAWSDIGQCALNLADTDMAIEAFQLSLTLAPANFYAWAGLGQSFLAVRRYSEAVTAFDQALACKEEHRDSYVADLRAEALRGLNDAANNMAI